MKPIIRTILAAVLLSSFLLLPSSFTSAQVPQMINYQGRVTVGGTNFHGTGYFRFALVDAVGNEYWGSSTTPVTLPVTKGLYSVLLGDTNIANMSLVIPASVFTNTDVRLRVWFGETELAMQHLVPDQRVAAVGYAMMADTVTDGAITSGKLAAGAVGTTQLASNAVASFNIIAGAVGTAQLAANAIQASNIATGAITGVNIASNFGYAPLSFNGGWWRVGEGVTNSAQPNVFKIVTTDDNQNGEVIWERHNQATGETNVFVLGGWDICDLTNASFIMGASKTPSGGGWNTWDQHALFVAGPYAGRQSYGGRWLPLYATHEFTGNSTSETMRIFQGAGLKSPAALALSGTGSGGTNWARTLFDIGQFEWAVDPDLLLYSDDVLEWRFIGIGENAGKTQTMERVGNTPEGGWCREWMTEWGVPIMRQIYCGTNISGAQVMQFGTNQLGSTKAGFSLYNGGQYGVWHYVSPAGSWWMARYGGEGDADFRFNVRSDGSLWFGDGTGTDSMWAKLRWGANGTLQCETNFHALGTLTVGGLATFGSTNVAAPSIVVSNGVLIYGVTRIGPTNGFAIDGAGLPIWLTCTNELSPVWIGTQKVSLTSWP